MTKREVVWLIVRLIGVYFAYLAIVSVLSFISAVATFSAVTSQIPAAKADANTAVSPVGAPENFPGRTPPLSANRTNEKPIADAAQTKLADDALETVFFYIFLIAVYAAAGFYLIKDGRILFVLLNREERIVTETKEINSLGIFDQEK